MKICLLDMKRERGQGGKRRKKEEKREEIEVEELCRYSRDPSVLLCLGSHYFLTLINIETVINQYIDNHYQHFMLQVKMKMGHPV